MKGMQRQTGVALGGTAHLAQSIADILSTPIGSRVMRRDYGSELFALLDGPMNALGRVRLFAAIAAALARWEPRLRLTRVGLVAAGSDGAFTVSLEGRRVDLPDVAPAVSFSIPLSALTA